MMPLCLAALLSLSVPADAACVAEYKASRQGAAGLELDFGVVSFSGACTPANARQAVIARIAGGGWKLLRIVSVRQQ